LGSKISLISKADIRYEGRLFTVDPIECTIALASVRSYGTEDRETQYPIHPQNQVYEYILFRGSDIKDIRVINTNVSVPNDPAIMQMHLPPTQQQSFSNTQYPGNMAHMGTPMGGQSFGNLYAPMSSSFTGQNLAPGAGSLNKSKQSSELNIAIPEPSTTTQLLDQGSLQEILSGGSRSTTPTSRKSPSHDIGTQVNQSRNEQTGNNSVRDNSRRGNRNKSQQRERKDSSKNEQVEHKTPQRNQQYHGNNQRNWNNNRGANVQMRGNRPRGRGMQQNFTQNLQGNKGRGKTIKFGKDYDFEEANKEFENMCLKNDNVKVGEEANAEQVNGETDKKDDSGNETGAGEHEVEEDYVGVGYDKTKSFFDNISCEAATDRTKGKTQKDWNQERKINSETFGVSARRGGFFSYRGRGGGYYNRNSMNPGGYRGNMNYNRGGNYRSRNYNRNYNSNSTGIPQQNNKSEQPDAGAVDTAAGN
ncbi:Protein LSM14 like A, partial [Pseudolycoriella hygida]